MRSDHTLRGYSFAIIAGILWGVSGTFAQFLFQFRGLNPEWLVSARLLTAGTLLLASSAARKDPALTEIWRNAGDAWGLLVFSVLGMLGVQYTFFASIQATNAATATIIQFLGPVFIALWLMLNKREWPGRNTTVAILLSVVGTFLLVTHGSVNKLQISAQGLFWGLTSAIALAFYSLQPADLLKKYGIGTVVGYGMIIGGLTISVVSKPWNIPGQWDLATVLCCLFIFIPATLVAFFLYMTSVKLIGPQVPSLLVSVEPVSAAILAIAWLKVPLTGSDWLGTACILGTIVLLTYGKSKSGGGRPQSPPKKSN